MVNNKKSKRAFTIVELVVVIAIIAVLSAVLIPTFTHIIKKAKISNDQVTARNLTTLVRISDSAPVEKPSDLKNIIIEAYGAAYLDRLAPESARYGYHFWFDYTTQTVLLATTDGEAVEDTGEELSLNQDIRIAHAEETASAYVLGTQTFEESLWRSSIKNGMYLIDRCGSALADAVTILENPLSSGDYRQAVQNVYDLKSKSELYSGLLEAVQKTAIVSETGTYEPSDGSSAVYFVDGLTRPGRDHTVYTETSGAISTSVSDTKIQAAVSEPIVLPSTVTVVASNALQFETPPVIVVDISEDDLDKMFQIDATNATIIANEKNYKIDSDILFAVDEAGAKVEGDGAFEASLSSEDLSKIVFQDGDQVLYSVYLERGAMPEYRGAALEKTGYTHDGWTPAFSNVQGDAIYTAVWKANTYTLYFNSNGGSNIGTKIVTYDEAFTLEIPTREGYGFGGWYDGEAKMESGTWSVTHDVTLTARWTINQYTITWKDSDGTTVLKSEAVDHGTTPDYTPTKTGYTFIGWTPTVVEATADATYTARWTIIQYTITWKDSDGTTVLKSEAVDHGTTPNYTPTKTGYTFIGWTPTVVEATADATYTARWTINQYTITWKDSDGTTVLKSEAADHGTTPDYTPTKEGYTFIGWTPTVVEATADATYTAQWRASISVKFANTDKYLYRVGNANTVSVSSLFEGAITEVSVEKQAGNASWTISGTSTIKFTGTGVVKVTANSSCSLLLEVVDGYNVTKYSELKGSQNNILLNDIQISEEAKFSLTDKTLWGNGFTFDISVGSTSSTSGSDTYLLKLNNAAIDNIKIIGMVYNSYSTTTKGSYRNAAVYTTGKCVISNSYISNCAVPVQVFSGDLLIENTTLKGGVFANMEIDAGNVTLRDVTTINNSTDNDLYTADNTQTVGLGIVFASTATNATITLEGCLTQYNWLSKDDRNNVRADSGKSLFDKMFNYSAIKHTSNGVEWVNTGILSMSENITQENIIDNSNTGYVSQSVSIVSYTGMVYTAGSGAKEATCPAGFQHVFAQGTIAPQYAFDFENKNYESMDGVDDDLYCVWSNVVNAVTIKFEHGGSFEWNTDILTVTKIGFTLNWAVAVENSTISIVDGKITFNSSNVGEYVLIYTYTDSYNYTLENGNISSYSKTYTQRVKLIVSEAELAAYHPTFVFGSGADSEGNSTTFTIETTNNNDIYIMPMPNSNNSAEYITIDGANVYYVSKYVTLINKFGSIYDGSKDQGGISSDYAACFSIFKDVIAITDYSQTDGTISNQYYSSTVTTAAGVPTNLSVVSGGKNYNTTTNDSATNFKTIFSPDVNIAEGNPGSIVVINDNVYYQSANKNHEKVWSAFTIYVRYAYTANDGVTYNYIVEYKMVTQSQYTGSCVTAGTLITLADGTQTAVENLTGNETLLVFDHETGRYTTSSILFIENDGVAEYQVLNTRFSDGTTIRLIYEHALFDKTLNKYVYITAETLTDYIGHTFVKGDGETIGTAVMTDAFITTETVGCYSLVTAYQLNYFVDGYLSIPGGIEGLFNIFDYDETMKYDETAKTADIEEYGLLCYEDLAEYGVTEEMFEVFNGKYLAVAIGKGHLTMEDVFAMASRYGVHFAE